MLVFCLDQLFNGDTREERQEARDLMVDNFDELSMYLVDVMDEIVRTGRLGGLDRYKQNINQLEGNSHCKRKRNSTSLKHDYRNYRMEVKKNHPAGCHDKYKKYLQSRRDYEKRRLEQFNVTSLMLLKFEASLRTKLHAKDSQACHKVYDS